MRKLVALALFASLASLAPGGCCLFRPAIPNGKYEPAYDLLPAMHPPAPLVPEDQQEGHTCGFHALSAIYRAHGMDPGPTGYNLRFRLGVDQPALLMVPDSVGVIHPDLYRVASQDGFSIVALDLESEHAPWELIGFLRTGESALMLTSVGGGILHWIALDLAEASEPEVRLVDSLTPTVRTAPVEALIAGEVRPVYSVIMLWPRPSGARAPSTRALHRKAAREMAIDWRRIGREQPASP